MSTDFEVTQAVLDRSDMSEADKALIKTVLWTQEELPDITSQTQYEAYAKMEKELGKGLPKRSSPEFGPAFIEWTRSREGILAGAYGAKMIEWEQLQD